MAASNVSGGSDSGGEDAPSIHGSSPVEASKVDDCGPVVKEEEATPLDESLVSTPKASSKGTASRRDFSEDAAMMDYSSSSSSCASPKAQMINQPVVSHVPASLQHPIQPPSSEQCSLGSALPNNGMQQVDGESAVQQHQPQQIQQPQLIQEDIVANGLPTFQVIHGTQGQVVAKRKGRFRLLQNAPIITDGDSEAGGTNTTVPAAGGDVHATDAGTSQPPITTTEGGLPPLTHPSRERSLSNASSLSTISVHNQTGAVPAMAMPIIAVPATNVLQVDTSGNPPTLGAPVVKKKGRFVVIPGDVTDPSLLGRLPRDAGHVRQITPTGQPFSSQQHILRQQTAQPTAVAEQVVGSVPQSAVASSQPMQSQDVVQHVQVGDSQNYQVPLNVPQHAQSFAGSVQHHLQQMNVPQYYPTAPQGAPQAVQISLPQHQTAVPVVAQLQPRTSNSPVPPSSQPTQPLVHQQNLQPPAQILVAEPPPTCVVQSEDGRLHHVVAATQQMVVGPQPTVPIPEQSCSSEVALQQQQTTAPQETLPPQQPVQFHSGTPVPRTNSCDAAKPPNAAKLAVLKRPSVQRGASAKGAPTNVGFGKVFYFLEQMKLEVTEADRTIKNQGRDMKFLVSCVCH